VEDECYIEVRAMSINTNINTNINTAHQHRTATPARRECAGSCKAESPAKMLINAISCPEWLARRRSRFHEGRERAQGNYPLLPRPREIRAAM
jgi:hypothetical protein